VKHIHDVEVELIMRTLVDAVQTYDQLTSTTSSCGGELGSATAAHPLFGPCSTLDTPHPQQLLSLTPPHNGGILPLSFGLFHQQEVVRDLTVDLFSQLRMFPVSHYRSYRSLALLNPLPPSISPPKITRM